MQTRTWFEIPIGGEPVKFRLSISNPSRRGKHHIFVETADKD